MVMDMGVLSELSVNIQPFSLASTEEKMDQPPDAVMKDRPSNLNPMERFISSAPTPMPTQSSREVSPAPSTMSSLSSIACSTPKAALPIVLGAPPAKRQKYTAEEQEQKRVEKEQRRLEKEERQRKRAEEKAKKEEEKAKKDEEKLAKDEERRQKNEIKEQKKLEKELEKQQKDDEKRRKEEERLKKENTQKRINSFFVKPTTPSKTIDNAPAFPQLEDQSMEDDDCDSSLPATKSPEKGKSDYSTYFLPFSLPSNSVWAPENQFAWDEEAVSHFERRLTNCFHANDEQSSDFSPLPSNVVDVLQLPGFPSRPFTQPTIKEIMRHIHGSDSYPIDLTNKPSFWDKPMDLLKRIPVKRICFCEDVRPPYVGTYTNNQTQTVASILSRNPFKKLRTDTNYDYDSEAEWEDPGEGEDLNSEGESETESNDGAEDLEGFLDDEEDNTMQGQRKRPIGDLEPICTGLCWEDLNGHSRYGGENVPFEMKDYSLEPLEGDLQMPIDPFTSSYWNETLPVPSSELPKTKPGPMNPPQYPVQTRITGGIVTGSRPRGRPPKSGSGETDKSSGPAKLLVGAELEEFKQAVQGSDLSKVGIIEVLKKRFPKVSKGCLKDTLNSVAVRVGVKDADKRWIIVDVEASLASQPQGQL